MPNVRNPFEIDDEVEETPIVKAPGQGINKVAMSGTKYAAQQAKALSKSFVSQLYGSSKTTATTDDDQQASATANKLMKTNVQKSQKPAPTVLAAGRIVNAKSSSTTTTTASTPEENEKLAETRRNLNQQSTEYYDPTFGNIVDVDANVRKEAQKRKQEEDQRKQEEEEEEKKKKEEKAKQEQQQFVAPKGRVRGQPPGVLKRSQTKAENKTGFSG